MSEPFDWMTVVTAGVSCKEANYMNSFEWPNVAPEDFRTRFFKKLEGSAEVLNILRKQETAHGKVTLNQLRQEGWRLGLHVTR